MDEFNGRDVGDERDRAPDGPIPELWPAAAEESLLGRRDPTPRDLFACPFCETPVQLTTRPDARGLVADCPCCETWFTAEEWRYYKQIAA